MVPFLFNYFHLTISLSRYALGRRDINDHTYAAIFQSLMDINRYDLVLDHWAELAAARVDIGPAGASGLIRACARARDAQTALRIFDHFLKSSITFNKYTYNCMVHLCAVCGCVDDAFAVYNLMRLETDPGCLPDEYTYSALVRAITQWGRTEMTQQVRQ